MYMQKILSRSVDAETANRHRKMDEHVDLLQV